MIGSEGLGFNHNLLTLIDTYAQNGVGVYTQNVFYNVFIKVVKMNILDP